jgi:hypothetical protein
MSYAFDFGPSTAPAPQYGRRSSFAPTTQPVYAKPDLSALLNSRPVDTNSAFFDDPANKKRTVRGRMTPDLEANLPVPAHPDDTTPAREAQRALQ